MYERTLEPLALIAIPRYAVLVIVLGITATSRAQSGSDRCDASLLPQITNISWSITERVAYLSLVTESNYEEARASGALNIIIDDLPIGASYQQFDQKRRQYMSMQHLNYDRSEARAIFRQSLSPAQLAAWTSCMNSDVPGVRIILRDDDAEGAAAEVHYVEAPGRSKRFRVSVNGGNLAPGSPASFRIAHGGSQGVLLKRGGQQSKIKLQVNGPNMTDTAVSLPPAPPTPTPADCTEISLLSAHAPVTASRFSEQAAAVTDGTPANWNALASPTQHVEIDLGGARRIRYITLNPEQTPSGYTQHRMTGRRPDGTEVVLGTYNGNTISGGLFTVLVPRAVGDGVRFVRVETVTSPSSVSWREIEVFGCQ